MSTRARKESEPIPQVPQVLRDFVLRNTHDPMVVAVRTTIAEANDALARLFGYDSRDELIGLSFSALTSPESFRIAEQRVARRLAGKAPTDSAVYTGVKKNGERFLVETSVISWPDDPAVTVALLRDVTARERDLAALRESEQLYRIMAEAIPSGILIEEKTGRVIYANEQMTKLTGYSVDELKQGVRLYESTDKASRTEYLKALKDGSSGDDYRFRLVRKDGSRIWVSVSWRPIPSSGGAHEGIVTTFTDVTERFLAEAATRKSEADLRTFLDAIPHPASMVEPDGICIFGNEALASRFNLTVDQLRGADLFNMMSPETAAARIRHFRKVVRTGKPVVFEDERAGRSFAHYLNPVFDQAGQVVRVAWVAIDVTERKQAESSLRESEERFRGIVENTRDIILQAAPDGRILYLNPAAERILGYAREELTKLRLDIIHPKDREAVAQAIKEGFAGRSRSGFEYRFISKSGREIWASSSWSPIIRDGKVHSVVSVVRDVTERRVAEDQLRKAHESLQKAYQIQREFLNNVTHEIRTPMTAVKGYVEMLLEGVAGPLNDAQKVMLEKVLAGTESLLQLVTSLLEVARLQAGRASVHAKACKPGTAAERAIAAVAPQAAKKGISIDLDIVGPNRLDVYDEEKIVIVLNNLLSNAVKFTSRGRILVQVSSIPGGAEFIVADTGAGIPSRELGKIFEEFRQIPRPGMAKVSGFGLGLSIVANMVTLLGGTLVVSSRPRVGTAFTLTIPRLESTSVP
ncbi:MAG: PAS domain S-box protein [Armatimonadota bacterium]